MNIQVATERTEDDKLKATVTIAAADIDKEIAATYADISKRYSFQGFRKGHVPRPVIDGMIGRQAVLAEATNSIVNKLDPVLCEELDVVPLEDINYGEDLSPAVAGKDFVVEATIAVRPECQLTDYDAPAINMPPSEPTDAEIDEQIDILQGYHVSYDDIEEDRTVEAGDIVSVDVENVEHGENFEGENRLFDLSSQGMPEEFVQQLVGMQKDETRELSWVDSHTHGKDDEDNAETGEDAHEAHEDDEEAHEDDEEAHEADENVHEVSHTVKVTLRSIKFRNVPELTNEYVKESYGFDSIDEFRNAVRRELETEKAATLPNIKENRSLIALAEKLDLEEIPETYFNSVHSELVQEFLQQLQRQGTTIDAYLQARGVSIDEFLKDSRQQASERARQSLALDALATHLELAVSEDELKDQFAQSSPDDPEAAMKEFRDTGRLPAVREAMLRSKALEWLVEHVTVTEVDEAAQRRSGEAA